MGARMDRDERERPAPPQEQEEETQKPGSAGPLRAFYDRYETFILMGLALLLAVVLWFFVGDKLSAFIGQFMNFSD